MYPPSNNNSSDQPVPPTNGFNSADTPPPPVPPTTSMNPNVAPEAKVAVPVNSDFASAPTPTTTPPPPTSTEPVGTPTVSSYSGGSSSAKKIIIGIIVLFLLLALGVGAYYLATNVLFKPAEEGEAPIAPVEEEQVTALCLNIKAYDTEWNRLSLSDLSSLKPGDTVRFSVSGDTSSGSFDMARFSVNSVSLGESTNIKPDTNEFYDDYIVPAEIDSFNVEAQLHHLELDQWI